jgi:histone acetyltransferase (RNA polymerase elongator complex component)
MRPLIVPFFLRNRGCPHRCVFCNERMISGNAEGITEAHMRETVKSYTAAGSGKYDRVEIAFYGGSFTGMAREEQTELLRMAGALIGEGAVHSVRVSTRPDEIEGTWLDTLKNTGVRAVEIGAQSMDDGVLRESARGHTAEDVRRAVGILKEKGFETGIHLMAGLPGESREIFEASVAEVIRLGPDTVRVHPVVVFRDTELARLYERGDFRPLTLEEAVSWCKIALVRFTGSGIPVIRLGLQSTGEMERKGGILAGPWHPAFRGLVEAGLFRDMALELIAKAGGIDSGQVFHVAPADLSNFNGMGSTNRVFLEARLGNRPVTAITDPSLPRGVLVLRDGAREYGTSIAEVSLV